MTLDEIELDQQVICTSLRDTAPKGNTDFRGVGHIGWVVSVLPLQEVALVEHIEDVDFGESGYAAFQTVYFLDELSPYTPNTTPLQNAIRKTLIDISKD